MKKVKKYSVEVYFYKKENENEVYSETPELDKYKSKGIIDSINASDAKSAKDSLLIKYPNAAYIHIHYVSDYSY